MRGRAEIAFRVKQEATNALFRLFPPSLPDHASGAAAGSAPLPFLPDPAPVFRRLAGSEFALECERIANLILERRFPLLGLEIATESRIHWRRDYVSGIETPPVYFRRISYLDATRAGDHKIVWELNRHQHLVLLAQTFRFTGRREYLEDIRQQLETWFEDNPFQCGINWTSALEVGFRALSWVWILHFAGDRFDTAFRSRFMTGLYRHGAHLAANLSVYFSPNTHLLGEALALHAVGLVFATQPSGRRWAEQGSLIVRQEMARQVREDGSHFEQSSYYHVYALDMFLLEAILERSQGSDPPEPYMRSLASMARFLDRLMPAGELPFLGDDDGGRLFHPFGERNRFGSATLATYAILSGGWSRTSPGLSSDLAEQAAWWVGESALGVKPRTEPSAPADSIRFADSGIAVMCSGSLRLVCDAGPFGPGSGGHSHSDTLGIVASDGAEELLIDPGTYTYVGSVEWRNWFRGSAAHNTIRIDGMDQADPAGPFRWRNPPQVETLQWSTCAEYDLLIAACRSRGVVHTRSILFVKTERAAIIVDDIRIADKVGESDGAPMAHRLVEQFWHAGNRADLISPLSFALGAHAKMTLWAGEESGGRRACERSEGGEFGWRSPAPGRKCEAILFRMQKKGPLPVRFAAVLDFKGGGAPSNLTLEDDSRWVYDNQRRITFDFNKP